MKRLQPVLTALPVFLALALILPPADAQFSQIKNAIGSKKPELPKKQESVFDDKSAEDAYLDMKDFAEGLYNRQIGEGDAKRESDFKRRVDTAYENLRRANAQRAYEVNLSAHSEVKHVIEDRFRVFSGLYDNLLVQDLLNRTGQSILPQTNDHLYTFKLIADPIPRAETLATGTIYISTGLVALLNTKAQLSYVLAHEAAHVYRGHFRTEIMIRLGAEEYASKAKANREDVEKKIALFSAIGGGILGATAGKSVGAAATGAVAGTVTGLIVDNLLERQRPVFNDWNRVQEDEADQTALEWVLAANQNIREIPTVYKALKDAGDRDDRVTLGFLGRSNRVRERSKKVDEWIALETKKPEFAKRVLTASDPDFDILLAEVKRDNGILAYEYDMLDTALDNLRNAVAIKTTDPTALYFYAKILQETARTDVERAKSLEFYRRAAENDYRNLNYGANLHRAVAMLKPDANKAEKQQAVDLLKKYLEGYYLSAVDSSKQQSVYPPHLETIYDYMSQLGEFRYVLNGETVRREAAERLLAGANKVEMDGSTPPATAPVINVKPTPAPAPKKPLTQPAPTKKSS